MEPVTSEESSEFIEELWRRFAPVIAERLASIERLAAALEESAPPGDPMPPNPAILGDARYAAHNLAGALGSYGRPHGSDIARRIQYLLDDGRPAVADLRDLLNQLTKAVSDD